MWRTCLRHGDTMGLFGFLKRKVKESTSQYIAYGGGRFLLGQSEDLFNSALWSCVVNLSRLYATLPWHAYKDDGNGDKQVENGTLMAELLKKPNPYMTDYDFRFVMGFNFEMHGEAAALIQRSRQGLPIALYPVSPSSLVMSEDGGRLYYTLASNGVRYPASDILLIRNTPTGYGSGSVLDPIYFASDDLDLERRCKAMQKECYNGASIIGHTISVPQNFSDEAKDKLRAMFNSGQKYRNYVIDERIKITPIQIASGDITKLSEAQKWNAQEVARRFNVPPFFIGDTTGTYNNSEQQGLQMVIYCLRPRVTAWESAINAALCRNGEYVKFSLEGLLRGDHATRSAFYHNAIMDGWMTINEVRRLEDLVSIGPDGDVLFFPMNYGTVEGVVAGKYGSSAASGLSVWDLPAGDVTKEKRDVIPMTEKRRRDLRFVAESKAPAQSNRAKIEKLIRAQLKAEIEELKRLIATGLPVTQVLIDFESWLDTYATEIQPQYKAIYLDILKKMVPVVQKETDRNIEVPETKIDAYADAYASSLSKRQTGTMNKAAKDSVGTDHFDDDMDKLEQDYPIDASEEEVNRSSNAFNVWLFAQLGVSVFHVVASSTACSFCSAIDGKVASVEGYVLSRGSDVDTGDGDIRHIDKDYRHPPFHNHCKCSVAPGE